jgi:DNA-directed RNA polymerase sigma subunit (sigma70/sigma32)
MAEASSRVKECRRRLRRQLKRLPTNEEIASDTGMPLRRVEAAMSLPKYTVSLTSKVGCTDMTYQVSLLPSPEQHEHITKPRPHPWPITESK